MRVGKRMLAAMLLALGCLTSPVFAQVDINVPGARVRVGGGKVDVAAPGVRVNQGGAGVNVVAPGVHVGVDGQPLTRDPNKEAYVGLFVEPISEAAAAQLGDQILNGRALIVVRVLPGSPAQKANIGKHDVLVSFDGHPLTSVEQFQTLLQADFPGRPVRIDLLRAGKRYSAEVVLGERDVDKHVKKERKDRGDSRVGVNVLGRVIVGRHGVDAPGAVIRWGTPAEVEISEGRRTTCSVAGERRDAATWSVFVTFTGPDDKVIEKKLEGTSEEIRTRLDEFPPTVADQVRRTMERAESDTVASKGVRVNVQPRVQGEARGLHVSIQRQGAAGGSRIFELDHTFKGEKKIQVDDLLEINVFSSELKELDPSVREQVEETLREVEIPEVRVDIRKSL
ncbi:MAG: PDZ domain-containing protein [Planctomycetaceae bacterium]